MPTGGPQAWGSRCRCASQRSFFGPSSSTIRSVRGSTPPVTCRCTGGVTAASCIRHRCAPAWPTRCCACPAGAASRCSIQWPASEPFPSRLRCTPPGFPLPICGTGGFAFENFAWADAPDKNATASADLSVGGVGRAYSAPLIPDPTATDILGLELYSRHVDGARLNLAAAGAPPGVRIERRERRAFGRSRARRSLHDRGRQSTVRPAGWFDDATRHAISKVRRRRGAGARCAHRVAGRAGPSC